MRRLELAEDDSELENPERGLYSRVDLLRDVAADYTSRTPLLHSYVRLDDYRDRDLDGTLLDALESALARVRAAGKKVILRFSYNFGPYPQCEPDADEERIVSHVRQLAPLLTSSADVIAWFEAGFIGCWGEWHTSTHGLEDAPESKLRIVGEMLESWPPLAVQIRYPSDLRLLQTRLPPAAPKSRLGFHHDCVFASEPDDFGTWGRAGGSVSADKSYVAMAALSAPTGGETCNLSSRSTCDTALRELPAQRWTDLNNGFSAEVLQKLEDEGCMATIRAKLGYRFRLLEAAVTSHVARGEVLRLAFRVRNEGWARVYSERRLMVVLGRGRELVELETDADARDWQPDSETLFDAKLVLPEDVPNGVYRIGVWLPDSSETLRHDPRYAIRFANRGVWDESGINWLSNDITIGEPDPLEPSSSEGGAGGDSAMRGGASGLAEASGAGGEPQLTAR